MERKEYFPPIRCRAPLRLGLAGGGTDLSPYSDTYGGAILNITIDRYAYTTIEPRTDRQIRFVAMDLRQEEILDACGAFLCCEGLRLHRVVYNYFMKTYNCSRPLPVTVTTWIECPFGSGLGASSALTVSLIGAFLRLFDVSLDKQDVAALAYTLEREHLALAGGRQDQYAAAYGGINYMEFCSNNQVIVTPLEVSRQTLYELEASLLLCFTGVSRASANIINSQVNSMQKKHSVTIESMHVLRKNAMEMRLALLSDDLGRCSQLLHEGWMAKKRSSADVSNAYIDNMYRQALEVGALSGKISGAGGGGFMMLLVDPTKKNTLLEFLQKQHYEAFNCHFTFSGMQSWHFATNMPQKNLT